MTVKEWLTERCREAGYADAASDRPLPCGGTVVVRKGAARGLKAGGAWIFDNEIDHEEGAPKSGQIVKILDFDGYVLGYGCFTAGIYSGFIIRQPSTRSRLQQVQTDAIIIRKGKSIWCAFELATALLSL